MFVGLLFGAIKAKQLARSNKEYNMQVLHKNTHKTAVKALVWEYFDLLQHKKAELSVNNTNWVFVSISQQREGKL